MGTFWRWFKIGVFVLAFTSFTGPANAVTIEFLDSAALQVKINGVNQTQVGGGHDVLSLTDETARTREFVTVLCSSGCGFGLSGVVLFEPRTSEVSDFVIASVTVSGSLVGRFTQIFFESDPDILFFANHEPGLNQEAALLNQLTRLALTGQIPKIDETGEEQVLFDANTNLFRDGTGALGPLPSDTFPFSLLGDGDFTIKVTSDKPEVKDIPGPTTALLILTGILGLSWFGRRHRVGDRSPRGPRVTSG
jgi:hypothetical protein